MKGRSFTVWGERAGPAVVIINQTMARHRFPNEDSVGKRIRFDDMMAWTPWVEIVGVAGDVKEYGLGQPVGDEIYGVFRASAGLGRHPGPPGAVTDNEG